MKVELTDLRAITRNSNKTRTEIHITPSSKMLLPDNARTLRWLVLGESSLQEPNSKTGKSYFQAYLTEGVTDFEHDSAHALTMDLIGVQFESIHYGITTINAFIAPHDGDGFHVPFPGYNPLKEATQCKDCKTPHLIVPEGYYTPPANADLYKLVQGHRVEISVGPADAFTFQ